MWCDWSEHIVPFRKCCSFTHEKTMPCVIDTLIHLFITFGFCLMFSHIGAWNTLHHQCAQYFRLMLWWFRKEIANFLVNTITERDSGYVLLRFDDAHSNWMRIKAAESPTGINNNLCTYDDIKERKTQTQKKKRERDSDRESYWSRITSSWLILCDAVFWHRHLCTNKFQFMC